MNLRIHFPLSPGEPIQCQGWGIGAPRSSGVSLLCPDPCQAGSSDPGAAERAEQQPSGGSSREVRDALETRAGQSKGRREPRRGWEAGAVLTLRLGKPSPGDVVLRRRWDQGHCCPARTPSTTPHRVLLIAELKKIPVFVHDQLESWEMLQSVSWGCRGH